MPLLAGMRLTAARLYHDIDAVHLTNQPTNGDQWQQWGTETVTFANPGLPVTVTATVTGRVFSNDRPTYINPGVEISFDGGETWERGRTPYLNVNREYTTTHRKPLVASHTRTGRADGDIVIRAMFNPSSDAVRVHHGHLSAIITAQP